MTTHIDFSTTLSPPTPSGMDVMVGVDGQHYIVGTDTTANFQVGCVESGSLVKTITTAQWQTDLGTLGFTLNGAASTYSRSFGTIIPAPGTPYFYVAGYKFIGLVGDVVWVRYKINSPSSIVVDGGLHHNDTLLSKGPYFGYCWGSTVINGKLYAVVDTGTDFPLHLSVCLFNMPLSGTHEDNSANSWSSFATDIASQYDWGFFRTLDSRQYYNRAALIADSGDVGILCYVGQTEIDTYAHHDVASALMAATITPSVYYVTVDPVLQTVAARQDISASFGVPFADTHKLFTGAASSDSRDDYTLSVSAATEVMFTRTYSDNKTEGKYVRFDMTNGVVTSIDNAQWVASGISVTTEAEMIQMYREGSSLITMLRDNKRLIFGALALAPYTPVSVPTVLYHVPAVVGCAYTSRAQLLRPDFGQDAGAPAGPAFGKKRRMHWYGAYLLRTRVITYGTDFTAKRQKPAKLGSDGGVPIGNTELFSGIISSTISDDYGWTSQLAWQQTRPTPGTILAVSGYLETENK